MGGGHLSGGQCRIMQASVGAHTNLSWVTPPDVELTELLSTWVLCHGAPVDDCAAFFFLLPY